MQKNKNFRYDINGLRAIAVMSVVIFHFSPKYSPGGFSGVDVFFVISGYLMTSIIIRGIAFNNFRLIDFYIARIDRIVPALAALTIFMAFFGWFFLSPEDYRLLAKHAYSSVMFVSNIVYNNESGYFDSSSYEKWLLHTWSLSVEWQFYIIYPLLLVISRKLFGIKAIKYIIVAMALFSLLFSVYITKINPTFSYFNLTTRAWEMLLGGIAFLYQPKLSKKINTSMSIIGILMIISSIFIFNSDIPWPGYHALLPTIGAFLVIFSNGSPKIITKNNIVQLIGRCSYSIYLWHWPIVILGYYLGVSKWQYYGIPLSIIFGFFSYKLIEQNPLIKKLKIFNKISLIPISVALFSLVSYCIIYSYDGVSGAMYRGSYISPKYDYLNKYSSVNYVKTGFSKKYRHECNFSDDNMSPKYHGIDKSCISEVKNEGILLWGDSHAQALSYGITEMFHGVPFSQIASSGCAPSSSIKNNNESNIEISCNMSNKKAMDTAIELNPKVIILTQKGAYNKNTYSLLVKELRKNNVTSKIIIVGPVPQWHPSLPKIIAGRHFDKTEVSFSDSAFDMSLFIDDDEIKKIKLDGVVVVSILDSLCAGDSCVAKIDDRNTPLVWDYGHLTLDGSVFIVKNILYNEIKKSL